MRTIPRANPIAWFSIAMLALIVAILALRANAQDSSKSGSAPSRIHLQPKLVPGVVLRYNVQFQTSSQTQRSGTVTDPQGPSQTVVTWDAVLRVEVLPAVNQSAAAGAIRLRTTYEKSSATLQSDTPDPEQDSVETQYAQMEGKSMEFTLTSDGHVSDVQGLEGIVSGPDAIKAAQQWMAQFSSGASEPAAGIIPGEKWTVQEPASSLPLSDRVWRSDSSYLRDEPCQPANPAASSPASGVEMCAVILTQLNLVAPRAQKDPTPQEYRANGLQTRGAWSGSGESLSYVSLQTGWVVGMTQSMSEKMDVTISDPHGGMRYAGAVNTHSAMSLIVPDSVPPASPSR